MVAAQDSRPAPDRRGEPAGALLRTRSVTGPSDGELVAAAAPFRARSWRVNSNDGGVADGRRRRCRDGRCESRASTRARRRRRRRSAADRVVTCTDSDAERRLVAGKRQREAVVAGIGARSASFACASTPATPTDAGARRQRLPAAPTLSGDQLHQARDRLGGRKRIVEQREPERRRALRRWRRRARRRTPAAPRRASSCRG